MVAQVGVLALRPDWQLVALVAERPLLSRHAALDLRQKLALPSTEFRMKKLKRVSGGLVHAALEPVNVQLALEAALAVIRQ